MDYKILTGIAYNDEELAKWELERSVKSYLKKGWKLSGSTTRSQTGCQITFTQAIIKVQQKSFKRRNKKQ